MSLKNKIILSFCIVLLAFLKKKSNISKKLFSIRIVNINGVWQVLRKVQEKEYIDEEGSLYYFPSIALKLIIKKHKILGGFQMNHINSENNHTKLGDIISPLLKLELEHAYHMRDAYQNLANEEKFKSKLK